MKIKKNRTRGKKVKKVKKIAVPVINAPVLFVPKDFPDIDEPIIILPSHIQEHELKSDPSWITRAWKWMLD